MSSLVRRARALALTALVIYGVAPAIGEVLGAWPKVANLKPYWLLGLVLAEAASCWCLWELQALSIGTRDFTAVATSQLAGGRRARARHPRRGGHRGGRPVQHAQRGRRAEGVDRDRAGRGHRPADRGA